MFNTMTFSAGDQFKALVYPQKHPSTVEYLHQQFAALPPLITDKAKSFFEEAKKVTDWVTSSQAWNLAREAVKSVFGETNIVKDDMVMSLKDMLQFQTATTTMQRWIMANPTVRKTYHDQQCDGYSDTYVDLEPDCVGKEHYDYRRVMDGVMEFQQDNSWKMTHYLDPLKEGDRELHFLEKVDILDTWSQLEILMALGGIDPTNPKGGEL